MTLPTRSVPGETGIWVLVFLDITVFGGLFVNYAMVRAGAHAAVPELNELDRTLGCLNTIVLLTSSLLVALAVAEIRHARVAVARGLILGALALGALFVAIKAYEYAEKFAQGITPMTNSFFNFFFSLTGLHLFHVIAGMGILLWMRTRMARVGPGGDIHHIESGGIFWHMVDLLWIVIFPLLYLL